MSTVTASTIGLPVTGGFGGGLGIWLLPRRTVSMLTRSRACRTAVATVLGMLEIKVQKTLRPEDEIE